MTIEWVEIEKLKPNPKNPNKHSPEQIARLIKIIRYQNWRHPIIVSNRSGLVVAGHGRLLAAKEIGLLKVPVHFQDFEDDDQEYAFLVSDNSIASWAELDLSSINTELANFDPSFDIDLLGIKDFILDLNEENPNDPDETPEVKEGPSICQPGELWTLGEHRLLCGDSTKRENVERLMGGEKARLWLTDPPYGVSYQDRINSSSDGTWKNKNRTHETIQNDHMPLEEMRVFWTKACEGAYFATDDKASYYWFACQGGDQMMMMMSISDANWKVRHELIWAKDQIVFGRCDYHYKHEPILYGWKKDGTHEWCSDRTQTSLLEFPRPKSSDLHPTMKPIELLEYLLKNNSKPGALLYDSFLGSGSTLIACEKTNRKCYGMEIDPHYCDVILARFAKFSGKDPVREDGVKWSELVGFELGNG